MKKGMLAIVFQMMFILSFAQLNIQRGLTDNQENPIGIGNKTPRFTWIVTTDKRNLVQTAYQIIVYKGKLVVWNSGKVDADQSVFINYGGSSLQSNTKYNWKVKVWTSDHQESSWSALQSFQTSLLNKSDWKAKWILPGFEETKERPSPLFRKEFNAAKKILNATAYITAHGLYEAKLNGKRIGDAYLTPGWTSYKNRLQFQSYDVTSLLSQGNNAIGVSLGSGWYRGIIGFENKNNAYGTDVALLFQLHVKYTDGSEDIISSDDSWKSSTGSIRYSEIYNGETIDARLEQKGWDRIGFNDKQWTNVKIGAFGYDNLIYTQNELVKKQERLKPIKIFTTPKGEKVIDFGQNLSGWVVMKVKGNKGDKITLSHAEVLDKFGNFYTENLRSAKAQDVYILSGDGEEVFEPHFTWQGFRFLKVEGYPGDLKAEHFEANVLNSNMAITGSFSTSNPMVNQLQHNILWGQKGNFIDVPTDCPQRDERLGWTGDAQVFSRTATFNMNVHNFFIKWLKDIEADQIEGKVPFVVPNVLGADATNSSGWSDVATIVPWNIYLAYGDKQVLQDQYNSMVNYVASIGKVANNHLWNSGWHFGDWLFYRPADDNDGQSAVTDKGLIATSFYAHSTQLLINTAKVLGKNEDVIKYTQLLDKIKAAFVNEFVTPNGRLLSSTQTAYVLALNFDLLPEPIRQETAKRLVDNINNYGVHLTTGFLGTPYLCNVLTRFGYNDIAYKLLLQPTYPSWLYPVKMGATTIWERWDGQKTDSTFQSVGMNSFNHYSYGAIGDWMYRNMVGLDTYEDGVGYKHSKIQPHIGGDFKNAEASLDTYYGKLSCSWVIEKDKNIMKVNIPFNTRSTVFIPSNAIESITENGTLLSSSKDFKLGTFKNGYVQIEVGAGNYTFEIKN
jgi:alpha-L-rhamnosidase